MSGVGQSKMLTGRALIIDDNVELCRAMADTLRARGCTVETATDPVEGVGKLQSFAPDVLITDVRMPGLDGFSVLDHARQHDPLLAVVVITAFASVSDAVRAMRNGAEQYLAKPVAEEELLGAMSAALSRRHARFQWHTERGPITNAALAAELIGRHEVTQALRDQIADTAESIGLPVMILGESGTDRLGVSRAIHATSSRSEAPFLALDCSALTGALLDIELFGSESAKRDGRLKSADGGTLFLDQFGSLSDATQTRVLRLLHEGKYERIGGRKPIASDVRLILGSDCDSKGVAAPSLLDGETATGSRLRRIEIPPLRRRKSDVPILIEHLLANAGGAGLTPQAIVVEPDAMLLLSQYAWPGNVHELESLLDRYLAIAPSGPITAAIVAPSLRRRAAPATQELAIPGASFEQIERHAIIETYESCGRNVLQTARILGISPRLVHYRLQEYRGAPTRSDRAVAGGRPSGKRRG